MFQKFVVVLCIIGGLFAQSSPIQFTAYEAIYPYDLQSRGKDIYTTISNISTNLGTLGNAAQYEIAIQLKNGFLIRNVINRTANPYVVPTPNYTILIFGSTAPGINSYNINGLTYYIVPVEQIAAVLYSPYKTLSGNPTYTNSLPNGDFPYFSVNVAQRANDIANLIPTIKSNAIFRYNSSVSSFSFQTTVSGNPLPIGSTGGKLNYVQAASFSPPSTPCGSNTTGNGTLLFISYNINKGNNCIASPNVTNYLIAGPDQIIGFAYFFNGGSL